MWSFTFFPLGFQSQRLDHFLALSASQEEQLLLFACRWPTIHGSSGLLTSRFPPSITGTQEVQLPPHRAPHSEARHLFHLLRPPPPPAPAVACCSFPRSLCQGPRTPFSFLQHVCLTCFSHETLSARFPERSQMITLVMEGTPRAALQLVLFSQDQEYGTSSRCFVRAGALGTQQGRA